MESIRVDKDFLRRLFSRIINLVDGGAVLTEDAINTFRSLDKAVKGWEYEQTKSRAADDVEKVSRDSLIREGASRTPWRTAETSGKPRMRGAVKTLITSGHPQGTIEGTLENARRSAEEAVPVFQRRAPQETSRKSKRRGAVKTTSGHPQGSMEGTLENARRAAEEAVPVFQRPEETSRKSKRRGAVKTTSGHPQGTIEGTLENARIAAEEAVPVFQRPEETSRKSKRRLAVKTTSGHPQGSVEGTLENARRAAEEAVPVFQRPEETSRQSNMRGGVEAALSGDPQGMTDGTLGDQIRALEGAVTLGKRKMRAARGISGVRKMRGAIYPNPDCNPIQNSSASILVRGNNALAVIDHQPWDLPEMHCATMQLTPMRSGEGGPSAVYTRDAVRAPYGIKTEEPDCSEKSGAGGPMGGRPILLFDKFLSASDIKSPPLGIGLQRRSTKAIFGQLLNTDGLEMVMHDGEEEDKKWTMRLVELSHTGSSTTYRLKESLHYIRHHNLQAGDRIQVNGVHPGGPYFVSFKKDSLVYLSPPSFRTSHLQGRTWRLVFRNFITKTDCILGPKSVGIIALSGVTETHFPNVPNKEGIPMTFHNWDDVNQTWIITLMFYDHYKWGRAYMLRNTAAFSRSCSLGVKDLLEVLKSDEPDVRYALKVSR